MPKLATSPFAAASQYAFDAASLGGLSAADFALQADLSSLQSGILSETQVKNWAKEACFDTAAEVRNALGTSSATTLDSLTSCVAGDVPVWDGSRWACGEQKARHFKTEPNLVRFGGFTGNYPGGGGSTHEFVVYIDDRSRATDPECSITNSGMTRVTTNGGNAEEYFCFCNKVNLNGSYRWWCLEVEP